MADETATTDAPDPTGGTPEQLAAKAAATALGDQDAENLAESFNDAPPDPVPAPTAELVRRHPDWYGDGVKRDFGLIGGENAGTEVEPTDEPTDEDTDKDTDTDSGAPLTDAESTSSSSTSATIKAE